MTRTLLAAALALAFAGTVAAQTTTPCPAGTVTCNTSTQHMGDTNQTASADDDQSQTTQAGGHSNSIASGVTMSPDIQQSGNANSTQSDNHITATGGHATGNTSSNANNSSASTGAQTLRGGNQGQGQGQSSRNAVTGGNQSTATNVDASQHSQYTDKSNFTVIPEQPAVPMSFSPSTQVTATADPQCGPYQEVVSTPVYGYFFGTFKTKKIELDHNDTLAPPSRYDEESTMGVRAIYTTSVVNVAGARSLSIGGGGSGGFGQGNAGASSSMTVMVTHIQLRACRMVQRQETRIIYVPETRAPIAPVAKRIWHKRVTPKACPPVTGK